MDEQSYDKKIKDHYDSVAQKHGAHSSSTMEDQRIRDLETETICDFVNKITCKVNKTQQTVLDVGCGNGYTLSRIIEKHPHNKYIGIEYNKKLRSIAKERFQNNNNVAILSGDIRNVFYEQESVDILICQRVLINLLSEEDQKKALENIIDVVKSKTTSSGGFLLFLESFQESLNNLNIARAEFNLQPMKEADHNLYLKNNFFENDRLTNYESELNLPQSNFLSTHYYVSRVMHEMLIDQGYKFKRNSEFVTFFSQALPSAIGDYSPLKLKLFSKS